MSMSIKESCDLNTVLHYLLAIDHPTVGTVAPEAARDAALRLVGKAHLTLGAGLMPHQVSEAWPMPARRKKGAAK